MRKITVLLAALAMMAMAAVPASADAARQAECQGIDPGPNVTATYTAGAQTNGAQDRCVVVSTATNYSQSVEQVNNPRAAKAVSRVTETATTVTTTQEYRWQVGQSKWVSHNDPITEEEQAILDAYLQNPGNSK